MTNRQSSDAPRNADARPATPTGGELPQVRLNAPWRTPHPWIISRFIDKPAERIRPGTVVDILDCQGQWLGRGFYNAHARIGLRVLTTDPQEMIDEAFFAARLARAIALRHDVLRLPTVTDAYRVVHSEGDGLSGLVVDRFGDVLVLQFFAAGMYRLRSTIQAALLRYFPGARFYWFADEHVQKQEAIDCVAPAPPPPLVITEHGIKFWVTPGSKHKTGFFADQRDNRRAFADLCANKRVLDLCCYTGGFALYAKLLGNAREVTGVDLDADAIETARRNAQLNATSLNLAAGDLFDWLREAVRRKEQYGVVVLDPSRQTRDPEKMGTALRRYEDMNRLALQVLAPGGVILTCSCTGMVSEELFLRTLRRAARQASRTLQVFRVSGAAGDHPFLAHVPESRYLKAVWARAY